MTDHLWAPWRMTYITAPEPEGCFLCRAWESPDQAAHHVLLKGSRAFVIMNLYPYNNGHLMVATAAHLGDLEGAGAETRVEVMELVNLSVQALREAFFPEGFNIGVNLGKVAGAGVDDHLHVHVVPRWRGDTNFMPVCGEVKVISEHIESSYAKLLNYFHR